MIIYDLDLSTFTNTLEKWNEPVYRAKQIWQGLYQQLYDSSDQFTNLPKSLREKLAENFTFSPFKVRTYLDSSDGFTRKTLFELPDGNLIEAVLMRYGDPADNPQITASPTGRGAKNRRTLCISTQAGCAMGCVFCATGQMGFKRHLTSGEIVAQVIYYAQMLKDVNESVTNIVLMGMGEPFHNYENTMAAIDRLNNADGFNFGARRFTISTVGLVPQIRRFADEKRQVNLAISLHAASDETRSRLMPVNRGVGLEELLAACRRFPLPFRQRITFEYTLLHQVNDEPADARLLVRRLAGLRSKVNLIPFNDWEGSGFQRPPVARIEAFQRILLDAGLTATVRWSKGEDVGAACGQLRTADRRDPRAPQPPEGEADTSFNLAQPVRA
jgi:23S rRNA (adenine2503-C2)-methyltransferase